MKGLCACKLNIQEKLFPKIEISSLYKCMHIETKLWETICLRSIKSLWGKVPDLPRKKCTNKRVMNYQLLP